MEIQDCNIWLLGDSATAPSIHPFYSVLKLPRWRSGVMRSQSPKNENPTNKPSEPPKSETREMNG